MKKMTIELKGAKLEVSANGKICQNGKELKQNRLGTKRQYMYVSARAEDGHQVLVSVARAVCQAFRGEPASPDLQADHIDSDPTNNHLSNLRWATRKDNNCRKHAIKQRSKNAKHVCHKDEVLQLLDPKTNERLLFKNGRVCAQHMHCSTVAVYIKPGTKHKLQRRWLVSWVPKADIEALADEVINA